MNTENNKIIVVFMGAIVDKGDLEGWFYGIMFPHGFDRTMNLKYHESYDWLMPVVKKIKSIYKNIPEFWEDWNEVINKVLIKLEIDTLYQIVVDFIKWYNQHTIKDQ